LPAVAIGDAYKLRNAGAPVSEAHVDGGFLHEFGAESSHWRTHVRNELLDSHIPHDTVAVGQLCKMHIAETALTHELTDFQLLRAEHGSRVGVVCGGGGGSRRSSS
jgi:hypothetical protein